MLTAAVAGQAIVLEQREYVVGDRLSFHVEGRSNYTLELNEGMNVFRFLGEPGGNHTFIVEEEGALVISLFDSALNRIDQQSVMVFRDNESLRKGSEGIFLEKVVFSLGEDVVLSLSDPLGVADIDIYCAENVYAYHGMKEHVLHFTSPLPGACAVQVVDTSTGRKYGANFTVVETKSVAGEGEQGLLEMGSREQLDVKSVLSYYRGEKKENGRWYVAGEGSVPVGELVEGESYAATGVVPSVGEISLEKVVYAKESHIELDSLDVRGLKLNGAAVYRLFVLDGPGVVFSQGELNLSVKKKRVFVCEQYSRETLSCIGDWNERQNVDGSVQVQFSSFPVGIVEGGLASINTNKSRYHPGEEAKILVVVLDENGYLVSNATVIVTVTTPAGVQTALSVVEESHGVYGAVYAVGEEGEYLMDVFVPELNESMESSFLVSSFYAFDIIRSVPPTVDPWRMPVTAEIAVANFVPAEEFTLTEVIPSSFQIIDPRGAEVRLGGDVTYLTWGSLDNGSVVEYIVRPPLVSPALYALGEAWIDYGSGKFVEGRPWFLAVDPDPNGPDVEVAESDISVGNESLVEGETVTVFAEIHNVGIADVVQEFAVQFFSGNPAAGGSQIGGDIIISNISSGGSVVVNMSLLLEQGNNTIFVLLDPANLVNESDEENNNASKNFTVPIYSYYYGNFSKTIAIDWGNGSRFMSISDTTVDAANLFVADSDSQFLFGDLQAIGRDTENGSVGDDFTNLDSALNLTAFNDSIKRVWGQGTDVPLATRSFNVSTGIISNVPVMNSTLNETFVTGILWDTADDASRNGQYDLVDREDVVFITEMNRGKEGQFGSHDFEIRVPAALRNYNETTNMITFYYEFS